MTLDPRDADPFRAEGTDEPVTVNVPDFGQQYSTRGGVPVEASDLIVFGGIVFVGLVVVLAFWWMR